MKKKIHGAFMIALGLVISSCNGNNPQPTNGVLNCNLDGNYWESTTAAAVIQNNTINITGQISGTNETITITIQSDQEGTYALAVNGSNAGAYVPDQSGSPAYTSNYTGGGGSVTVSEINTTDMTITGIFEFTGVKAVDNSTVEVTDGHFTNIPYTENSGNTFNNSFTADVDGNAFNPNLIYGATQFNKISITASENGSFPSIGLSMPDDVTPGTYSMSAFGDYQGLYNVSNSQDQMYSAQSSGSITITTHNTTDKIVEGTFAFLAEPNMGSGGTGQYNITNGTFAVEY